MPQALKPSDAQSVTLPGTTFGANLTVAREHVGLSREQLGTRAGLNAATIYDHTVYYTVVPSSGKEIATG